MSAAQVGKTDGGVLDEIGRRLDQKPVPILYVGPTKQFVTEQFEPRLMALLDQAPVLAQKVARGKRMTKTRKVVAGVPVRLAHGGSSAALKSDPAGVAFVDEYDEMLANVKGQGDPLGLVLARGDTYADFVVAVNSTPSVGAVDTEKAGGLEFWKVAPAEDIESPIWKLWQQGTRHHWAWPCPHCGEYFIPRFRLLRWTEKATPAEARRSAHLICPAKDCGGVIEDGHKAEMNRRGVYVAPGQTVDAGGNVHGEIPENSTISFWASGLASPFVTFGQRAERFLKAVESGDQEKIQTAVNAGFGELFAQGGGEAPEWLEVARLKMPYLLGTVPAGVMLLTCGVDVQKNRLIFVIRGWGARATSWLIQHGDLWGNTAEPEVWAALDDLLEQRFAGLPIRLTFIDSGFRPNKIERGAEHVVYEFCRRHQRNVRPSKGYETMSTPIKSSKIEVTPVGNAAKYGLDLIRINTDWCKLWVHERIRWPQDQPGAWHLAEDTTDDYCMQIVSEARVRKPSGRATWVQRSRNNHYLDAEAMAYAAGYMLNAQRIRDQPKDEAKPEEVGAVPLREDKPPPSRQPRVIRSNYLSR